MKTKKVTKLWKGRYVSVRDYEVDAAIKKGGLKILHGDQSMTLTTDELKQLKTTLGQTVTGKVTGKSYRLFDIAWTPLAEDSRQEKLI